MFQNSFCVPGRRYEGPDNNMRMSINDDFFFIERSTTPIKLDLNIFMKFMMKCKSKQWRTYNECDNHMQQNHISKKSYS